MNQNATDKKTQRQSGFTLLEMLLTVGIVGLTIVGVAAITTDLSKQRVAQSAGQQMSRIAELTEDTMLRTYEVTMAGAADTLSNASSGGNDFKSTAIAVLENNSFPINKSNFLIANSPVDVIYGLVGTGSNNLMMMRIIVVLKKPLPLSQAAKVARAVGGRGGLIRSEFPGVIKSAFGNWEYPISSDLSGLLAAYSAPPSGEAYVFAYSAFSQSDKRGPYLSIYGGSQGENVMHTDIMMNGNSIVGAKDIDVGTLSATRAARFDQLAVNGKANFQGSVDANNTMEVKGDLSVTEGNMSVTNGDLQVPGGQITAKGLRADTLEAEDLTTKDVYAENLNVKGGDTLITSNVTVSGGATLDITGPLKATVVDAGSITTDTMKTENLAVKDSTTLGGETTIKNTANIDQLILNGTMCLNHVLYPGGGGC
jgi:prepilin-type N-terminal cleavage/methylation domain-containing protein